ncbi:MAG: hypothetical protein AB1758_15565 [Candidatus Eremiobacterota bacterium]
MDELVAASQTFRVMLLTTGATALMAGVGAITLSMRPRGAMWLGLLAGLQWFLLTAFLYWMRGAVLPLFEGLNLQLPLPTRFLILLSVHSPWLGPALGLVGFGLGYAARDNDSVPAVLPFLLSLTASTLLGAGALTCQAVLTLIRLLQ